MHPAPSVIFFSVFSGLGFGMLFWLGLGMPGSTGLNAFIFFFIAFAFAVGGLLSSTFHLGNPQRALKAFSQWQSSWLSREAWVAVGALVTMGLFALGAIFGSGGIPILGWLGALFSIATVFTTSMIYAQLKTVPRWNHPTTPALFLLLSLGGGALLAGQIWAALPLITIAAIVQFAVWTQGDKRFAQRGSTQETATGLGSIGTVRSFEPPHTGTNYLMKEMVHQIGRKHALRLRTIALVLIASPVLLAVLPISHLLGFVFVLFHVLGVLTSRWLFFAEAEHVVGLYYGKR